MTEGPYTVKIVVRGEGIVAILGDLGMMPLVTVNQRVVDVMMPSAHEIARKTGKTVTLLEFSEVRIVEEIS